MDKLSISFPLNLQKYPTIDSRKKLAQLFHLENDPQMQDWEIEVADPLRITEFLDHYESVDLNEDDRFLLMALIIASFDELDENAFNGEEWNRVSQLLIRDYKIQAYTIWYWSAWEYDLEPPFMVTLHIRPIWQTVEKKLKKWLAKEIR